MSFKISTLADLSGADSLMVAKIIVAVIIAVGWNYVLHRYFVFKDAHIQTTFKRIIKKL